MTKKLKITVIGSGRLGTALVQALVEAKYKVDEVVFHRSAKRSAHSSERNARKLARTDGIRAVTFDEATLRADVIWIAVGDGSIAEVARQLAQRGSWKGKTVFHSSGALTSRELQPLKRKGAQVASVHPLMSFVHHGAEATFEVPFALEGDAGALRVARKIVQDLGGESLKIAAAKKPLYHAFGAFLSPLVIANLALAERVGVKAGVPRAYVRQAIAPILATTVFNYITLGADAAFSGPLVRGDVETVRKNLGSLKNVPDAEQAYRVLAQSALRTLAVKNRRELGRVLARNSRA